MRKCLFFGTMGTSWPLRCTAFSATHSSLVFSSFFGRTKSAPSTGWWWRGGGGICGANARGGGRRGGSVRQLAAEQSAQGRGWGAFFYTFLGGSLFLFPPKKRSIRYGSAGGGFFAEAPGRAHHDDSPFYGSAARQSRQSSTPYLQVNTNKHTHNQPIQPIQPTNNQTTK